MIAINTAAPISGIGVTFTHLFSQLTDPLLVLNFMIHFTWVVANNVQESSTRQKYN